MDAKKDMLDEVEPILDDAGKIKIDNANRSYFLNKTAVKVFTVPSKLFRSEDQNDAIKCEEDEEEELSDEEVYYKKDITEIMAAIEEYHLKTCLRFRSYNESDTDYIVIQGSEAGCWSSVGRQGGGQVINLQNPGCVKHGTIVHEILHAVGFHHQQSSFDRDEYVKIIWENIQKGKENNFKKYNEDIVTDYGVGYDYGSIMHYSSRAFTINGGVTIIPLKNGAQIGQRSRLSKKDITKLQAMYKTECNVQEENNNENISESVIDHLIIFPNESANSD